MITNSNENICLNCRNEWTKRTKKGKSSVQCPKCSTRKWFEPNSNEDYFEMFGQQFVLIDKVRAGRMTSGQYVLDPTPLKDMNFNIQMYEVTFLSLETKDIFVASVSEEEWNKLLAGELSNTQIPNEFYNVVKVGLEKDKVAPNISVKIGRTEFKYIGFEKDSDSDEFVPILSERMRY